MALPLQGAEIVLRHYIQFAQKIHNGSGKYCNIRVIWASDSVIEGFIFGFGVCPSL
jgi:hypothetical protein